MARPPFSVFPAGAESSFFRAASHFILPKRAAKGKLGFLPGVRESSFGLAAGRAGAVLLPFSVFVTYMAAKAGRKKTTAVSSYRQTEEYDEKSLQAHGL